MSEQTLTCTNSCTCSAHTACASTNPIACSLCDQTHEHIACVSALALPMQATLVPLPPLPSTHAVPDLLRLQRAHESQALKHAVCVTRIPITHAPDLLHLQRATQQKGMGSPGGVLSFDPRAGFLPFEPFVPGDPSRCGCLLWCSNILGGPFVLPSLPR